MRRYTAAEHSPKRSNGELSPSYNPFRRLRRRFKTDHTDGNDGGQRQYHPPSPPPGILAREDVPQIHGHLFELNEISATLLAENQPTSIRPELISEIAYGKIDEEKSSQPTAESNNIKSNNALLQFLRRQWVFLGVGRTPTRIVEESVGKDNAPDQCGEYSVPHRKRRVIVVEYGNTDNVHEVTAETVRQSWKDPEYSEMEVQGYPVDENGQQRSRKSTTLSDPLKNSLRKFMPQQGTANLRVFYIQDDREAFLSLGHAFHMSFFAHRINFRAWAINLSHASEEPGRRLLLEHIGGLYPMQTVFWGPDRMSTGVRTAFGMEYPVLYMPGIVPDIQESEELRRDVASLPETSEHRLSVYIQLKKIPARTDVPREPDLGLDENTIVILDSMRKDLTNEELLDGVPSWKRLMHNAISADPLAGNPVLVAAIRLIFDAVAAKWSDYILSWLNYVTTLEEQIYSQPANDKFSPLLWGASKRLQQAERLLKFHVLLIENVQHELVDIIGSDTVEKDWLRQSLKEFTRLSSEVEESLRKPIAQLVDLMYKSISIRDARQSLELNTSLWRLSWITFTFLPLTFLGTFFGMNVSELNSHPSVKWYFIAAVPLMMLVMILYLSARKLMRKDVDITQPWVQQPPSKLRTV